MTLEQFEKLNGFQMMKHRTARSFPYEQLTSRQKFDIYRLSDYKVTSISGGSIWIVPTEIDEDCGNYYDNFVDGH